MRTAALAVLIAAALAPSSARAVVFQSDGPAAQVARFQQWADQSRIQTPGVVALTLTGCPGRIQPACALPGDPPEVWIDPAFDYGGWREERRTLWHEVCHVFDYTVMRGVDRVRFVRVMGDPRGWRSPGGNSPHEEFAEACALCGSHQRWATVEKSEGPRLWNGGGYGYDPTRAQHRRVCAIIQHAATVARGE